MDMFRFEFNVSAGAEADTETTIAEGTQIQNPFAQSSGRQEEERGNSRKFSNTKAEAEGIVQQLTWTAEDLGALVENWSDDSYKRIPLTNLSGSTRTSLVQVIPENIEASSSVILSSILAESDVRSGVYEGGFKVWECTFDLINYLEQFLGKEGSFRLHDGQGNDIFSHAHKLLQEQPHVLELGCGAGLPGCIALNYGYNVTFQDLNSDVLEQLTLPTIYYNCGKLGVHKSSFISGAWNDIHESLRTISSERRYPLIIASEILYNEHYYSSIWNIMTSSLAKGGISVLASKRFYFGVGGGATPFINFIKQQGNVTEIEVTDCPKVHSRINCIKMSDDCGKEDIWSIVQGPVFEDKKSNLREIIILSRS